MHFSGLVRRQVGARHPDQSKAHPLQILVRLPSDELKGKPAALIFPFLEKLQCGKEFKNMLVLGTIDELNLSLAASAIDNVYEAINLLKNLNDVLEVFGISIIMLLRMIPEHLNHCLRHHVHCQKYSHFVV